MVDNNNTAYTDTEIRKAQEEIIRSQVERFRNDYSEYFERDDTRRLVKFFFERIYDLEAQDTIIQTAIKTYDKVKGQLAAETRENLENLIELNRLTHALDREMAILLLDKGWQEGQKLTLDEYFDLYVALGREDDRRKQLLVSVKSMVESYQLAHKPFSEMVIKAAKGFAVLFGVMPLYRFADEGYQATKIIQGDVFNRFIEKMMENELAYIVRAFGE